MKPSLFMALLLTPVVVAHATDACKMEARGGLLGTLPAPGLYERLVEPSELRIYCGDYDSTPHDDAAQTLNIEPVNDTARNMKRTFELRVMPGKQTASIDYRGTKTITKP